MCFCQTLWTAIAAIGTIAVAIVAVIPILRDRARISVHLRHLEEVGTTGRYKIEISATNSGRRVAYLESIEIGYVDYSPTDVSIGAAESELHEGKRRVFKQDSWALTAIAKPKYLALIDSLGRKWKAPRPGLRKLMETLQEKNQETPKTIRQETREKKKAYRKYLREKEKTDGSEDGE